MLKKNDLKKIPLFFVLVFMALGISSKVVRAEEKKEYLNEVVSFLQNERRAREKSEMILREELRGVAEEKLKHLMEGGFVENGDDVFSFVGEDMGEIQAAWKTLEVLEKEKVFFGISIAEQDGRMYGVFVSRWEEEEFKEEKLEEEKSEVPVEESSSERVEVLEETPDTMSSPFRNNPVSEGGNSVLNPGGNPALVRGYMSGIDISSWQTGIDLTKVPGDFVVIKATQGVSYVNPDMVRAYQQAKAAGKVIGFYHYASGGGAEEEAKHFLKTLAPYLGEGILVLDWESDQNLAWKEGVPYAKKFLDYVKTNSGITPLIYMSKSVTREHNWASVAGLYGLWVAQYANMKPTGYQGNPWTESESYGAWRGPKIHQYSSMGQLPGYQGYLDLNKAFMDRMEWQMWAKKSLIERKAGWEKIDGNLYYLNEAGVFATGWLKVDGKWYYLDSEGKRKTGWQKVNEKWYYLDTNGVMVTGWRYHGENTYYMKADGSMTIGWYQLNGQWYYFLESGKMATGWRYHGENTYYLKENGTMVTGWQTIGNRRFYFDENGIQAKGWKKIQGIWFLFQSDGVMLHGWQKVNHKWYYLEANGAMVTGWRYHGENTYYMKADGSMTIGWYQLNGKWYYFLESGKMATGWRYHGDNTYYMKADGSMTIGWHQLNGKWYYFLESGKMATGWRYHGENTYYLKADGSMATGRIQINGRWYYFGENGLLKQN